MPNEEDAPDGPLRRAARSVEPLHVLIGLTVVVAAVLISGPILDIDVYWHVLIGREITHVWRVGGLGTAWSLNPTGTGWQTTQWLSEVILARTQAWFGWRGVMVLRDALGLALVLAVAVQLLRRSLPRVAAPVFAIVAVPVASTVQDRPSLATLLLTVLLAGWCVDLLLHDRRPRLWLVLLVVALWANLHGGWVLAPTMFGAVAIGLLLEDRRATPRFRSAAAAAGVAVLGACLTPLGPRGLVAPFRFTTSTSLIEEWRRTELWSAYGLVIGLLLCALVWAWARGSVRPGAAELVYVLVLVAFAAQAYRNVAPTMLLLAPLVVERLSRSFTIARAHVGRRERIVLGSVVALLLVTAVGVLTTSAALTDPLKSAEPIGIARTLAATPGEKRVLNSYNASGVLAVFGGPGVRLAVDGRADRYGNAYLEKYVDAFALKGDWQAVLKQADANYAVLGKDGPLADELRRQGWREVRTDGFYVLLAAPDRAAAGQAP